MATEESFRYRHAAPPTHDGHDDDEQEEDDDDHGDDEQEGDGGRRSLRLLLVGEGGDCKRQKLNQLYHYIINIEFDLALHSFS